jgi:hypothetical protein
VDVHNNTLINNDVGIYLFVANNACTGGAENPTRNSAHNNTISNDAVTNISGFGDGHGYQAGVDDVGNRDQIHPTDRHRVVSDDGPDGPQQPHQLGDSR